MTFTKPLSKFIVIMAALPLFMNAQDHYPAGQREKWLDIAKENTPKLIESIKRPVSPVKLAADAKAFQGYKAEPNGNVADVYQKSFKQQSGTVLDFGEHLTGYFTFTVKTLNSVQDAPLRFKLTFGEIPSEVAVPFDPYTGGLSRAWLQDETVTVIELPATITIPRRLSFRYVKIELLGSSPYFDFTISDAVLKATTSAKNTPAPLATATTDLINKIDAVGLTTLKECMQTVFEDGPKRDRRLWIGDVYLQAQANTYSFKQHDLTKRCLYLLAALSQEDGYLYSNIFEAPQPHAQERSPFLFDYALLYNVLLKDYLAATNDKQTAADLWPVAKRQMDNITTYLDANGVFDADKAVKNSWWLFVDWNDKLDRQAALQGVMIFSMKQTLELAKQLGKEKEVAQLPALITKMTAGALNKLYDKKQGVFISGTSKQVSYASQSWLILAGVVKQKEAQKILKTLQANATAVRPGGPYLYHYYVQALINSGLTADAKKVITDYWGGMVNKGADTFWEVYDPTNDELSPYNFFPINSYCHAWSCTPVYFIRKYPEIFQTK
ncbi:alpha-L-rhamnosidase-related protein [Flavobacterium psychrotrophum]|uniref:alpha-L-rhamnosidase-related protein n=1 Tax=Flavobacterium psychrotrophum TaxID=2294119 RepID=UPI000E3138E1|nr:family 78 glycoside hydrolase catalytic domain [Flavobacterium psychrotrophum]